MPKNIRTLFVQILLCFVFYGMSTGCHRNAASQKAADEGSATSPASANVDLWLTTPDKSSLFHKEEVSLRFTKTSNQSATIDINETRTYQPIDGFGFTLTGGSAYLIGNMDAAPRAALLKELFAFDGTNIGISYLRVSIGASDLDDRVFSYDDLPPGETDSTLSKFSLAPDKKYLIPLLKEVLAINPQIKILGSPWSPPTWMKTNDSTKGGSLKLEFYNTYANYFVKYVQGMKSEGITIDAITIQNEPLHPGNNPSMLMLPAQQGLFIKNHLGPVFKKAGINTKIILYDHNADRVDYPISILDDADARKYVDGSAFHLYGGSIDALSTVHNAYPEKNLYFTEQWIGAPGDFPKDLGWHIKTLVIGGTRNWCRNVLQWNLAADPKQDPHTIGGCDRCLGGLTINGNEVTRNPAYYIIAHASKFVRPGSVRIESSLVPSLNNVAFKTRSGNKVLIVQNDSTATQSFNIRHGGKIAATTLPPGGVGTYVWR